MDSIIKYLIKTLTDRNTIAVAVTWIVGYIGLAVTEIQLGQMVEVIAQIVSLILVFLPATFLPILGKPKA